MADYFAYSGTDVPKYFIGGNATFAVEELHTMNFVLTTMNFVLKMMDFVLKVEDLSISCTAFYNNIITDGNRRVSDPWVPCKQDALPDCGDETAAWSHSRGVRIRRVRIRADCFFRLVERDGPSRRGLTGNFTYEQVGAAIQLNGQEYEVTDNDIYASMHGMYLGHNQGSVFNSASVGIIARNTINFGGDCYQIDSSSHVIFEQNGTGIGICINNGGSCINNDGFCIRMRRHQPLFAGQRRRLHLRWPGVIIHLLCAEQDPFRFRRRPGRTHFRRRVLSLLWEGRSVRNEPELPQGPHLPAVVLTAGALP